jgi:hypothetical protein
MLQSASTRAPTMIGETTQLQPLLAGWLDSFPSALHVNPNPAMRSATLARVPLEIRPTDAGTHVRIDGGFVRLSPSETTMGMPYDEQRRQWIANAQTGRWLVGFVPPKQIGTLRPLRVTLACDGAAPQHTIALLGDQVADGTPTENLAGRRIAEWSRLIDRQTLTFDPTGRDIDRNGHVWLQLNVSPASDDVAAAAPQWSLRALEMTYDDAEVVAREGNR